MDLKKLVNQTVMHKSFGKGVICNVDPKYLEICFAKKGKVSKFPFPSCFDGFLILEDCGLQKEISSVVKVWKEESGIVQKEELWHQYEETIQGIEARRLAAEEKRLKAARRVMEHRATYNSTKRGIKP